MAFNITVNDLRNRVQDLAISPATTPNETVTLDIIAMAEALVTREAEAVGVVSYSTGDDTYIILRTMAIYRAIYEVLISRSRGNPEGLSSYMEEYAKLLGTLRHRPQSINDREAPQSVTVVTAYGTPGEGFGVDRYGLIRRVISRPIGF